MPRLNTKGMNKLVPTNSKIQREINRGVGAFQKKGNGFLRNRKKIGI